MRRRLRSLLGRTSRQAAVENAGQRALEAQQARQALDKHRRPGRDSGYGTDGYGTDW